MGKGFATALVLAIAGAFVAGIFGLYTANQNSRIETNKLEVQKQLAAAQAKADKEKAEQQTADARLGARQRYAALWRAHQEKEQEKSSELNGAYWTLSVTNHCTEQLKLAFRYEALDGLWVSMGWAYIDPGASKVMPPTRNSAVYYIGKTAHFTWQGQDNNVTLFADRDLEENFRIIEGEPYLRPTGELAAKEYVNSSATYGPKELAFDCPGTGANSK
jgi:hypothetical protein